ncbi:MAG: peptidyl-prolyl cis-trans isomerase [Alphaproteobacteria bacterium]|nr:peptidyl-prolyl cis-trans isomerase [Alphaproteobacteria bacterium]
MKTSLLKSISLVAFLGATTPALIADPAAPATTPAPKADHVVAEVDGQKFTYSQIMEAKASLPKQYQSAPDDKILPVLANQAVDTYLINKAAQAAGEAQKPEVEKAIAKAKESIIAQGYLLDKVKPLITDAALKAKYDEVIKNFPQEKEVHLSHILVNDQATAVAVIKALKSGSDFKTLAKTKSTDETAKAGGELGFFRRSELPKELGDAAFALTPGSYSQEPVKTDFGWHVLKVEGFRDAKPPKFDEVKNELKGLMTQEAIVNLVKDLRKNAKITFFDKDGKPLPLEAATKPEAPASEAATAPSEVAPPPPPAAPSEVVPPPAPEAAPAETK